MLAIVNASYLSAVVLLIVGLRRLSSPKTARSGNLIAAVGMGFAILVSMFSPTATGDNNYIVIFIALAVGAAIGLVFASRVAMTAMPELVSLFNGLGGACAVAIATIELLEFNKLPAASVETGKYLTTLSALFIGAVAFTGSLIAYGKLAGKVKDKWKVPASTIVNIVLLLVILGLVGYQTVNPGGGLMLVYVILGISLVYGITFVLNIGGADMPVVISLLNALTGVAAALAGIIYGNQVMLVGGILVGSSGTILTVLMCQAMNRSLMNVLIGGFGSSGGGSAVAVDQSVKQTNANDAGIMLRYSSQVVVIPGYGMAVAQAQKTCKELELLLEECGVAVKYAIHPVAGRMPGHMNVLLAEADVDYTKLLDLEDANKTLGETDVAIVVGANDVVNPSALDDPGSPIYGMPILEILKAKNIIVLKRGMSAGYSGIENPLFFHDKTQMLFGDAKSSLQSLADEVKMLA
jgi:NAD(P) transhydrogenase subunit beta